MEAWIFVSLAMALWFFIAPALGIAGFMKARTLESELRTLKRAQKADTSVSPPKASQPNPEPSLHKPPTATTPLTPPTKPAPQATRTVPAPGSASIEAHPKRDWERLIAANWIVWVGGIALALGGLLLARFVWEAGLINEFGRVGLASLLGMALIGAAIRAENWTLVQQGHGALLHLPTILAAAGITTLNGAVFASGALYQLVPPLIALAGYMLVAGLAVALGLRFGKWLAALGLVGAYVGPLLTGANDGSVTLLLAYATSITGASLTLIRLRNWTNLIWITLAGAGFWGLAGLSDDTADWAVPIYALANGALGVFFASETARTPLELKAPEFSRIFSLLHKAGESLLAGHIFAALSGGLIFTVISSQPASDIPTLALLIYCSASLLTAWQRPGLALLSPMASLIAITSLLIWPNAGIPLEAATLSVAIGFGVAGTALMDRMTGKAPMAIAAALTPPAALFVPVSGLFGVSSGFLWGIAALGAAIALGMVLERLRQPGQDFKGREGAGAAYGLGAVLCALLAPFALLEGLWLGSALGVMVLAIALIYRRFELPILAWCGAATTAGAVALLMRPLLLRNANISTTPIFNELLFGFGIAILALTTAAWLATSSARLRHGAQAGALILGFNLVGLEIRHLAQGGDLFAPGYGMGEASAYSIAYIGLAASLAWRLSMRWVGYRIFEYAALGIGAIAVLLTFASLTGSPAAGVPIFNLLLLGFAMPALLLALYAEIVRRKGRAQYGDIAGWAAMGLGFAWATLEARRTILGEDLSAASSGGGVWVYSLAWLLYAVFLLGWGTLRQRPTARFASLGVLLIAICKVFLLDLSLLDGAVRAASFIGLGLALIAIALFYQRFVFTQRRSA